MKPEEAFDRYISPSIMPLTATYTAGGVFRAYEVIANSTGIHHVTLTEAVMQISLSLIGASPAIIGGVTLAGGMWLKHLRTSANDEREYRRQAANDEREHQLKLARLNQPVAAEAKSEFPFGRVETAKPNEDTVDLK